MRDSRWFEMHGLDITLAYSLMAKQVLERPSLSSAKVPIKEFFHWRVKKYSKLFPQNASRMTNLQTIKSGFRCWRSTTNGSKTCW